jgi:RNA polymerase sigma-32 factor
MSDAGKDGGDDESAELEALKGEIVDDVDVPAGMPAALDRRGETALSTRDPLAAYMRDVQRYSLLTPEEEHRLAVAFVEDGDLDAARTLVTSNLRLVVKIAYGYRRAYRHMLDLVQEGNIGLLQAVQKYDPYRGVKLSTYAAWWIRAYILRFILNNWRLVKLGTTQAQRKLFFNLKKEKARLSAMGIDPTPDRIAKTLNVSEDDVVQMDRRLAAGDSSLDAPVGDGEGRQLARIDTLRAEEPAIDDLIAAEEVGDILKAKIREFGAALTGKERAIFDRRLMSDEPLTLQELGAEFGVSRERVRQIEKRVLERLKQFIHAEVDQGVLEHT